MRTLSRATPLLLALAFALEPARAADLVSLVGLRSEWRHFKGAAEPSPGSLPAWRLLEFPDGEWSSGPAPFGYGEPAHFSQGGTEFTDMQNQYSTIFLRRRFHVTRPEAYLSLTLRAICDDGFIAWINGQRVAFRNAPAGEPRFNSVATANAPEPAQYANFVITNLSGILVSGENQLAVQVFNVSLGSSDLLFDAELLGQPSAEGPPAIASVQPAPGVVAALNRITVTFTEPVQGIRAEDFLINGVGATSVQGNGAVYTFTFPAPPYGPVEISWGALHEIRDFENPPQRFELAAPGSTWAYELIDPEGPSIAHRQPPAGSTVRALTQIEIAFNKAVAGIDASDLLLNGVAATSMTGLGAGPYRFEFPEPQPGPVTLSWAGDHGIVSDAFEPRPFQASNWSYTFDPNHAPAPLQITEIMAENFTSYRDEDQDPEDWIEIHNPSDKAVNLEGWSLSDDPSDPGQWIFPARTLAPGGYLIVFASGKDRRSSAPGAILHANFKLNPAAGFVALYPPELPRQPVSEVVYGIQGPDYSWGRENNTGAWRYFRGGTPGSSNGVSSIVSAVADVHFSVQRGFFRQPFDLILTCRTPGAEIRYTTDGSPPTETQGIVYTGPIRIPGNRVIRAAAFKPNALPSRVATHTYLVGLSQQQLRLPAISLVTSSNHLFGRTGIMEVNPRNTTRRGPAWERPVSVEYIRVEDNSGFQADCGIRIQGGDYVRGLYNYRSSELPFSKYSFRLYFRGEYGPGRLRYPLFPDTTQESFDTIVLRAGMNDHSNPFMLDEFTRALARDVGQPAAAGTFVHLFLNGVYKGYYNPTERIDVDFLRAYHGGGEAWDIMAQSGEVREGDPTAWNALRTIANTRDLTIPTNYLDIASRLDLTNFVDYLCPLIYADNDDWPHNNWRAARERVPGGLFRMYAWDCEWTFGHINGHGPSWDTIANQLSTTSPPWGGTDIQRIFNALRRSPEFRLLFADRVHKHFFNDGALTDQRIRARYSEITNRLNGVVPNFNNRVGTWIPQRRQFLMTHLQRAGFLASSNAPALSQHGGTVAAGYSLVMTNLFGDIYFTTNGVDPRVPFTGEVHPTAARYTSPLVINRSLQIAARSLNGTNWSALAQATFEVRRAEPALEIVEIMCNPLGGDAYEFIEILNRSDLPLDLSGYSLGGVEFRFPTGTPPMPPGARWVIASGAAPAQFAARYPGVEVAGWWTDGGLNNTGENIEIIDPSGRRVAAVTYSALPPWPAAAASQGYSLVRVFLNSEPNDPRTWRLSANLGGSPGLPEPESPPAPFRFSEIAAGSGANADWVEIENISSAAENLDGWSLTDNEDPRRYVFPSNTRLQPGARIRVWCANSAPAGELRSGFGLSSDGESLALYNPAGELIDTVTFGAIPNGYTLSRLENGWAPSLPTPLAPNEPAAVADVSQLAINEWLANPPQGGNDWIEIHNRDASLPATVHGLILATANAEHRVGIHAFVPPSGFLVLRSSERFGPDRMDLRLPAAGGSIELRSPFGELIDRATYSSVAESVTVGRLPDGTGTPIPLPGAATPGASNRVASGEAPMFNEWMAINRGSVRDPQGRVAGWIELRNPSDLAFSLSGARIRVAPGAPAEWTFPSGISIPARGFLLVWCDPNRSPSSGSPLNSGLELPAGGGVLTLLGRAGEILDSVTYGPQVPDVAVGRSGIALVPFQQPTPGSANTLPISTGPIAAVRINEWLADAPDGPDWIELHNPGDRIVDMAGCRLTDDPSIAGASTLPLPPLSLIAPGGHQLWFADNLPEEGPNHLPMALSADGEALRLYNPVGLPIDAVVFGIQMPNVSSGRFPDGGDNIIAFTRSASPGQPNWRLRSGIVFNEILPRAEPPLEQAIELLNTTPMPLDISGWWLSDDARQPQKFQFPAGTRLLPHGFLVLYQADLESADPATSIRLASTEGGELWLSETDPTGALTGWRVHAAYEPAPAGVSLGRQWGNSGWELAPQISRTFGRDNPSTVAEFRAGAGLPNSGPAVGPVILSEIHYLPSSNSGPEDPDEFIELRNITDESIPLFDPDAPVNTWRLRGGVFMDFPLGAILPPRGFAVLVPFNPSDTARAAAFRARFHLPAETLVLGPFDGRLSSSSDEIRLERPGAPDSSSSTGPGSRPYFLVEKLAYRLPLPWPVEAAPANATLQRIQPTGYANYWAHWKLLPPSPGAAPVATALDADLDGLPDDWELAHGLNPNDPADAAEDPDEDGFNNLAEYLAGSDPRDPASALRLELSVAPSVGRVLGFRAAAGRTYVLEHKPDAGASLWEAIAHIPAETFDRDVSLGLQNMPNRSGLFRVVTPAVDAP